MPTELLERGEAEKEVKSLILDKMSYCRSLQEVLVKFVDDVSKIQMHERVIIPNSYVEDSDWKEEWIGRMIIVMIYAVVQSKITFSFMSTGKSFNMHQQVQCFSLFAHYLFTISRFDQGLTSGAWSLTTAAQEALKDPIL